MKKSRDIIFTKVLVSFLLVVALLLPTGLTNEAVEAATEPSIPKEMKIGKGSIVGKCDYYSKDEDKYCLSVLNPIAGATYSFELDKKGKEVLSIGDSKGSPTVYLTGKTAGTAKITCKQKLGKETSPVGTCTVTVVDSTCTSDYVDKLPLGTGKVNLIQYDYRNNDATYTYVSSSTNFLITEKKQTKNGKTFISQTYTAKKEGTYVVTIKEKYKGKEIKLKEKITFNVKNAIVESQATVYRGFPFDAYDLINYRRTDTCTTYKFKFNDNIYKTKGVAKITKNNEITGLKEGKTQLEITEMVNNKPIWKKTCNIIVVKAVLENLKCSYDSTEAYVGESVSVEVVKEPYKVLDKITVTSSNKNIATVTSVDKDGYFKINPVKEGNTKITVKCADNSYIWTFTVLGKKPNND